MDLNRYYNPKISLRTSLVATAFLIVYALATLALCSWGISL